LPLDVLQDDLGRNAIELNMATRWEERKPILHLPGHLRATQTRQSAIAEIESKLPTLISDEIEDREARLAFVPTQAAAELLKKHRGGLGRPKKHHCIDAWQVDAFVEQIYSEDHLELAALEVEQRLSAFAAVGRGVEGDSRDSAFVEVPRHKVSMCNTHTEAESAHGANVADDASQRRHHFRGAGVVARVDALEVADVVPAAPPGQPSQVDVVVNAEVLERAEHPSIDGVPQTEF
jgi:hypothetical protein